MTTTGNDLAAETLRRLGVEKFFFLMGGPMLAFERAALDLGLQGIDVRHEQAAAMMAQAYSRITNKPGLCMAASGPGTINLTTGLAHALVDCAPVIAIGGSGPISEYGKGGFQEFDHVEVMKPVTKWAGRVYETRRIPELIDFAFRMATSGKPGPVFLDIPGDVLYRSINEDEVVWPDFTKAAVRPRPWGDPSLVEQAIGLLAQARRPVVLSGGGVIWSQASEVLREFVETLGIPLYTTPQGRGVLPEDQPLAYLAARASALREADFMLVVGTRLNYVFNQGLPPRIAATAKMVRIDIDPVEAGTGQRPDVSIQGDARAVMGQLLTEAKRSIASEQFAAWRQQLASICAARHDKAEAELANAQIPIHPLRLCREIRDFIDRDAILVVDGQEILNYGRQSIPTFVAGHRLNSGTFGTMGVGLPLGLGAKAASPHSQVVVLHGDGSFGMNGMELDTAVRHGLPVIVVVSLNGGWTADPEGNKPGRDLGYTRFDLLAQALGCHGEFVESPEDIRPALERAKHAVAQGKPALVNVVTDSKARAVTVKFAQSST